VDSSGLEETADTMQLQQELENASAQLAELKTEQSSEKAIARGGTATLTEEAKDNMKIATDVASLDAKSLEEMVAQGRQGIQAEFGGVISNLSVTEGAVTTQGMQLFTLHSTDDMSVQVNISKYDFDKLEKGQRAEIILADHEYKGKVTKIDRIAAPDEKGNTFINAVVKIDNPDEKLFIGVEAKVAIYLEEVTDVVTVPVETVNIDSEGTFCHVIEDGFIVKKRVETGASSREMIEVTKGLDDGAQVITDMSKSKVGDPVIGKIAREESSQ
jgi:RND family efflux transporter MFP subunit